MHADPRSGRRTRRRRSRRRCAMPSMPLSLGPGHAAALDPLQPSPYWGSERIWDTRVNNHNSMFDRDGPRLAGRVGARRRTTRPSARRARIIRRRRLFPLDRAIRHLAVFDPKTQEVHVRRHLLRHASPAVRLRRERHAVDERRRPGGRLAQHEDVRRDRRRGEVAGLDGARARHQRQRQARRLRRAEPAGRSDEGQAHQRRRSTR